MVEPKVEAAGIEPAQDSPGWIYLICDDRRRCKIGYAINIAQRFSSLQTGNADELRLVGFIPGAPEDERDIQGMFSEDHIRGEWYEWSRELVRVFKRKP